VSIDETTTREQLGAIVCEALTQDGHYAVLVGGSVVSIYTHESIPSDDLDFAVYQTMQKLQPTLEKLGFSKFIGNRAEHPKASFYVQFVNGPAAVGEKRRVNPVEKATPVGTLIMLSPLDCVLDRLAAFVYYNDRPCLRQAVEVAYLHNVSIDEIAAWLEKEPGDPSNKRERLDEFRERLERRKQGGSADD
jgi:hypothetical protein